MSLRGGRLIIPTTGLYYMYSQLYFVDWSASPAEDAQEVTPKLKWPFYHALYRYNVIYPNSGEELMMAATQSRVQSAPYLPGEYTSYVAGALLLRAGDEVYVKCTNPHLLSHVPELNYFGLFLIN